MTTPKTLAGGCLCGAVRFTASPENHEYDACHCDMCRRWTAGPFMSIHCGSPLNIEDDAALGVYRSSEWAERYFCKQCGTSLYYKLVGKDHYGISVEAFDDNSDFQFVSQIFIDEKPAHYAFANDTKNKTGAEVFAEYSGS